VQVWGCGRPQLLAEQHTLQQRDLHAAQEKQTAKRDAEWADSADRSLLGMVGLTVDSQTRVSVHEERTGHQDVEKSLPI